MSTIPKHQLAAAAEDAVEALLQYDRFRDVIRTVEAANNVDGAAQLEFLRELAEDRLEEAADLMAFVAGHLRTGCIAEADAALLPAITTGYVS